MRRRVLQDSVSLQGASAHSRRNSSGSSSGGGTVSPGPSLSPSPATGIVSAGYVHSQRLLTAHPRVRQLSASDVAKLVSSCCLAGWAPPQLFNGECVAT